MKWTEQQQPNRDSRAATLLRLLLAIAGGASFAWLSWTTPERHELPSNTVANASHDRRAKDGNAISASGGPTIPTPGTIPTFGTSRARQQAAFMASAFLAPANNRQPLIPPKGDQAPIFAAAAPAASAAAATPVRQSRAPPDYSMLVALNSARPPPLTNPTRPSIVNPAYTSERPPAQPPAQRPALAP